jgi:hypothetical protein
MVGLGIGCRSRRGLSWRRGCRLGAERRKVSSVGLKAAKDCSGESLFSGLTLEGFSFTRRICKELQE